MERLRACRHCGTPLPAQAHFNRRYCDDLCLSRASGRDPDRRWSKRSDLERLAEKVVVSPEGCWEWAGHVGSTGRGRFKFDGRSEYAHRASYIIHVGPIPAGTEIDHKCLNPICCNPDHLEPVVPTENTRRRRWARTHCIRGHAYTADNTYIRPTDGGKRCRKCAADAASRYQERKRGRAA